LFTFFFLPLFLPAALGPRYQLQVKGLQLFSRFLHEFVLFVVAFGVGPHQSYIRVEFPAFLVDSVGQLELDGLKVDRTGNFFVVVWGAVAKLVYWLEEGQDFFVGF